MATKPGLAAADADSDRLNEFLRKVVAAFRDEDRSDVELLARYVELGDQEAFRALVGRHGRSVWAACLAVLGDPHDAEDAFQAAFLALARRARSVDARRGIGPWVRSAARAAARKVRRGAHRLNRLRDRLASDPLTGPPAPGPGADEDRTWALAAEELEGLSRRLRDAVVMYHLEGRTLAQVAEIVGCSVAAAHRRVARGLEVLRVRLSARGVVLTAGTLAATPAGLVLSTTSAAAAFTRGGAVPPRVKALADAILTPRWSGWSLVAGATLSLAVGAAVALASRPTGSPAPPAPDPAPPAENAARPALPTAALCGRVTTGGLPVPGATVTALVRRPWAPGDRGLRDDPVARAATDDEGRYALDVPADFATHYPERTVTLLVSGPGLPPTTKVVRLGAGGADVSVPAGRVVRGVLIGPDGAPAPGVRVAVVRLGGAAAEPVQGHERRPPEGWPTEVVSGADGAFAVAGLPASEDVWVEVRDDRFALAVVRSPAGDPGPARVALSAPRVLAGWVTAADTGRPLAGARMSAYAGAWDDHHDRYTALTAAAELAAVAPASEFDTVTGPDGSYRLRLPATGPYRVSVHPPDGAAYLAVSRTVEWAPGGTRRELSVALAAAEVIRGAVRDDHGRPVPGAWVMYSPAPGNRYAPAGMLGGRDAPVRSAADGSFRLTVPPGSGTVTAFGPDANYRPATFDPFRYRGFGREHVRRFEHALAAVDVPAGRGPGPLTVTLRAGVTVRGSAVGPDGEPVPSGVLVCRSVVQPLRDLVPRPVPVRGGCFEVPGCAPDRVYPVVLLDPERRLGARAEVEVGAGAPVVKLEPCGSAEVRLVEPGGRPVAGAAVTVFLVLECDRPVGRGRAGGGPGADPVAQSWFDPRHYGPAPETDGAGRVTLEGLVPGAAYQVRFTAGTRTWASATFGARAGQVVRPPDVVARPIDPPKPPKAPAARDY